ncbi:hypothetical protein H2204_002536 [Knufia peltigerae]|uniref:Cupin type-2 domain-containing protein n=1 Tax=Knufia peltigerae TaxID=1002370 RepID=A0AA38YCE5_9EURO|nr:hypothetical protein H2204_002536 [Knufia peltigerae]
MTTIQPDGLQSPLESPTVNITTHSSTGQAAMYLANKPVGRPLPEHGMIVTEVYTSSKFPVELNDEIDLCQHRELMASGQLGIVNPNGTVIRFVDFEPSRTDTSVMYHRTQSLDYGVVLEGEMIIDLDDGSSTRLKRGDVVIQRGTMHAWRNASSTQWARMLYVLQDSQPVVVNGLRLKEDLGSGAGSFVRSGNDV